MAEDDFGSTIIFNNGVPDTNVTLGTTGEGERVSSAAIMRTQRETEMINQNNRIGGRGVGLNTMAQQPPPNQQFAGNYALQQPPPNGYAQPVQPVQQPPYYQQQPVQMAAPPPPQGTPVPIQGVAPQQGSTTYLEEPFSELAMTDDLCHVIVDLPGVRKEDTKVVLTQNNEIAITFTRKTFVSKLSAELRNAKKNASAGKSRAKTKVVSQVNIPDYILGTHTVIYPIPRPVDDDNMKCTFENGQVHVVLPFRTPPEGKTISFG